MPSAASVLKPLKKVLTPEEKQRIEEAKKKKNIRSEYRLPVYKLPGQRGDRQAICGVCNTKKGIPNTRRMDICNPCFKKGGNNVVMSGVDEDQITRWVAGHCSGSVEDGAFSADATQGSYLGDN